MDWLEPTGRLVFAGVLVGAVFQIWRRSGLILDELRVQRAERLKGSPLTEEEIEAIEAQTDVWWRSFRYQPPDKKA